MPHTRRFLRWGSIATLTKTKWRVWLRFSTPTYVLYQVVSFLSLLLCLLLIPTLKQHPALHVSWKWLEFCCCCTMLRRGLPVHTLSSDRVWDLVLVPSMPSEMSGQNQNRRRNYMTIMDRLTPRISLITKKAQTRQSTRKVKKRLSEIDCQWASPNLSEVSETGRRMICKLSISQREEKTNRYL